MLAHDHLTLLLFTDIARAQVCAQCKRLAPRPEALKPAGERKLRPEDWGLWPGSNWYRVSTPRPAPAVAMLLQLLLQSWHMFISVPCLRASKQVGC
jgi:hypothetical protein